MQWLDLANKGIRQLLIARGVNSHVRELGGHQLHVYRAPGTGRGPPVLLVHGLGSSANAFYRTMLPLAQRFSAVWAVDLPGNGFSPLPAGGPLSLRELVAVVVRFAREVVGEPVFLIGNSLGGGMCLYVAHEAPDLVRALGLVSPAGARVAPDRTEALLRSFAVANVREARDMTRRLFHKAPLPLLLFPGEIQKLYWTPSVRAVLREVGPDDTITEAMLGGLAMPTLLIWGQSEKVLPYEGLDYFRAHLPRHAEVHEVSGFGHMPQMERPFELVRRLTGFAQRQGLLV